MPAGESSKKKTEQVETELTGKVIIKKFGSGSKSEHDSVCLETDKGTFVLRRVGGNAFHDDQLHALVGKKISSRGRIKEPYFMITDFQEKK